MAITTDLTFGNLSTIIDDWNLLSIDLQKKYYSQKEALNVLFTGVVYHEDLLRELQTRLSTIKYYDDLMQLELKSIANANNQLEEVVQRIEFVQKDVQEVGMIDGSIRDTMYNRVGGIFKYLKTMNENLVTLLSRPNQTAFETSTEEIKRLWTENLNNLKKVEQMLYKLTSAQQWVECRQNWVKTKKKIYF